MEVACDGDAEAEGGTRGAQRSLGCTMAEGHSMLPILEGNGVLVRGRRWNQGPPEGPAWKAAGSVLLALG